MKLRRASACTAALLALSLALATACSEEPEGNPGQTATSASPTAGGSGEPLEGQDKISDKWPREIPLPAKYKIQSVSAPSGDIHMASVFAVSKEDVRATLAKFETNGFTKVRATATGSGGLYEFKNAKWEVSLIIGLSDANGDPTSEDTGMHYIGYNVGPAS
jgi:hypothetical protein